MKITRPLILLLSAAMVMSLASCGEKESRKKSRNDDSSVSAGIELHEPASEPEETTTTTTTTAAATSARPVTTTEPPVREPVERLAATYSLSNDRHGYSKFNRLAEGFSEDRAWVLLKPEQAGSSPSAKTI